MTVEPLSDEEKKKPSSELEEALRDLLVGEPRVKIDPATGQVISTGGEKSSLTGSQDTNTI